MEGFMTFFENEEYRGMHEAPGKGSGAPFHELTLDNIYPENIYTLPLSLAVKEYGQYSPLAMEALALMQRAKGRPLMPVKVYRAVPDLNKATDSKIKNIRKLISYIEKIGFPPMEDKVARELWGEVGRNKEEMIKRLYAQLNELSDARSKPLGINAGDWVTTVRGYAVEHGRDNLQGNYKIASKTVRAKDLYTDGNSPYEFGYDP